MTTPGDGLPRQYVLVKSDAYEADQDRAFLSSNRILGPEQGGKWLRGPSIALADLTGFPGPLSHARDEEASTLAGREVRRLLYYGPTRRRSAVPVRVLFTVLPPAEDDPDGEAVILLLRLLHGPQTLLAPEVAP